MVSYYQVVCVLFPEMDSILRIINFSPYEKFHEWNFHFHYWEFHVLCMGTLCITLFITLSPSLMWPRARSLTEYCWWLIWLKRYGISTRNFQGFSTHEMICTFSWIVFLRIQFYSFFKWTACWEQSITLWSSILNLHSSALIVISVCTLKKVITKTYYLVLFLSSS